MLPASKFKRIIALGSIVSESVATKRNIAVVKHTKEIAVVILVAIGFFGRAGRF
jgi:hypothetical protein